MSFKVGDLYTVVCEGLVIVGIVKSDEDSHGYLESWEMRTNEKSELYSASDCARNVNSPSEYRPVRLVVATDAPGHNRIDAGIDAATEAVDRIVPPTPTPNPVPNPVPVNAGADMVPLTDEDIPF